jgi:hypothetical protein
MRIRPDPGANYVYVSNYKRRRCHMLRQGRSATLTRPASTPNNWPTLIRRANALPRVDRRLETPHVPGPDAVLAHQTLDARQPDPAATAAQRGVHRTPAEPPDDACESAPTPACRSVACAPPPRQARKPRWLTDSASHSTGNGKDLRGVSIQASFTAAPARRMPLLF